MLCKVCVCVIAHVAECACCQKRSRSVCVSVCAFMHVQLYRACVGVNVWPVAQWAEHKQRSNVNDGEIIAQASRHRSARHRSLLCDVLFAQLLCWLFPFSCVRFQFLLLSSVAIRPSCRCFARPSTDFYCLFLVLASQSRSSSPVSAGTREAGREAGRAALLASNTVKA